MRSVTVVRKWTPVNKKDTAVCMEQAAEAVCNSVVSTSVFPLAGCGKYDTLLPRQRLEHTTAHELEGERTDIYMLERTGAGIRRRFYHTGGFKGYRWYNKQLDKLRSKRSRCKKGSRRYRNRSVYNDWGLYGFVQMLEYKCLLSGKTLHIVDEHDTSKTCHVCQHKRDMPLYLRTYRCGNCGLVMDRDDNSAKNIYQRFLARLGPHT
jgi:hypothetical protein